MREQEVDVKCYFLQLVEYWSCNTALWEIETIEYSVLLKIEIEEAFFKTYTMRDGMGLIYTKDMIWRNIPNRKGVYEPGYSAIAFNLKN